MQGPDRSSSKRRVKVYPALREMCLDYVFWPRQQLHIEELAGLLSSSATPVREALARLVGEGLIEAVPNRGYVAKALSEEEMRDDIDLLFALVRESINRGRPERWAAGLSDGSLVPTDDGEDVLRVNNRMFMLIARSSDNEALADHVQRLLEFTRFVRRLDLEDPDRASTTRCSIDGLRKKLATGDISSALQILQDQNCDVERRLPYLVKEGRVRSMSQQRASALVNTMMPRSAAAKSLT